MEEKYRIAIEPSFRGFGRNNRTLETWLRKTFPEEKIQYKQSGHFLYVIMLNKKKDLEIAREKIKELRNLYRALIPAANSYSMPQLIAGGDFNAHNKFSEGARGRHVPVGALPSELAKSRPLRIAKNGDIIEINPWYR